MSSYRIKKIYDWYSTPRYQVQKKTFFGWMNIGMSESKLKHAEEHIEILKNPIVKEY